MKTLALMIILTLTKAAPTINTNGTNVTKSNIHTQGANAIKTSFTAASITKRCSLLSPNTTLSADIEKALNDGVSMIEFKMTFRGNENLPSTVKGKEHSRIFKPFFWVRSTGRFSTRLLLLKPNYDIMSFKTLELQVKKFKRIELLEYPENCMDNITYDDVEQIIRELVFNNFKNTTFDLTENLEPTDKVCNLHIRDLGGADFTYYCCHREEGENKLKCEYLQSDIWLTLMRVVIRILKTFVILCVPALIPAVVYRSTRDEKPFIYDLPKKKRISVKLQHVVKWVRQDSSEPKRLIKQGKIKDPLQIRLDKLKHMPRFKEEVQNLYPNKKKEYVIEKANITEEHRLLGDGEAPASIFPTLYEFLIKCRVRELPSVAECCESNMFKKLGFRFTWYECMRKFMTILVMISLIIPWYIRIFVYYRYEHEDMEQRKSAAMDKGYPFYFPGNFTLYFTPLHYIFIVVYLLLAIDSLVITQLSEKYREKFQFVFRKCFKDMQSDSRTKAFGGIIQLLLIPFTSLGVWVIVGGIFMWVILIPIAVLLFAFYMFPTVNLTVRLIAHLVVYISPLSKGRVDNADSEAATEASQTSNEDNLSELGVVGCCNSAKRRLVPRNFDLEEMIEAISFVKDVRALGTLHGRIVQVLVIVFCLVTMYSSILIAFELITFFMDLFIYTFIGLVLYANYTMTYISLGVLLLVYGKDCFGSVSRKYRAFSSILNAYFLSHCEKQAHGVFFQDSSKQPNKAFLLNPCATADDPCEANQWPDHTQAYLTDEFDHHLCWKLRKVAFFLTKNDKPKIPSKLFFQACTMNYEKSPGRILHLYLTAMVHFLCIVAFLLFVLLVVLTFGESHRLSASNQLLGTIAGGILPFLLKNFIFMRHDGAKIDPEKDINFRVAIHDLINKYDQDWMVHDLNLKEYPQRHDNFTERNTVPDTNSNLANNVKEMEKAHEPGSADLIGEIERIMEDRASDIPRVNEINIEDDVRQSIPASLCMDDVTNIEILYDDDDVDEFDFPILYKHVKLTYANPMEPDMLPLNSIEENA